MEGLSTRGRYAVRILLYLVLRGTDKPVRIGDIADAEQIPQQYIEQLLIRLKVAGFVRSVSRLYICIPTLDISRGNN